MDKIEITASRRKFTCTSKDKIMYNGAVYILITQKYWDVWNEVCPNISKTEFNRLKKLGVLSEPHVQKGFSGMNVQIYNFKLGE